MTVTLDRVDVEGDRIRTAWTCRSQVLPGPMRGEDVWTIRAGKIELLETTFVSSAHRRVQQGHRRLCHERGRRS
jgi:hypothetical protein